LTTRLRSCDMNAIGDACKFTMKRWRERMNANGSSFNS